MKYKVGDKARIIDNIIGHQFNIGDIVTIVDDPSEYKDIYYAQKGDSSWFVKDEELQDVKDDYVSEVYSSETTNIVQMFMNLHSGKLSDYSRIEWPTAVKMAKVYLEGLLKACRGDCDYNINELENILTELSQ